MHDVGVVLDDELFGDLDTADLGDAADIVAPEIEQHQMLGALLGIAEQFGGKLAILRRRGATPARTGNRTDGDPPVAQPYQDLRTRSHDGETAEIEEEKETVTDLAGAVRDRARRAAG